MCILVRLYGKLMFFIYEFICCYYLLSVKPFMAGLLQLATNKT